MANLLYRTLAARIVVLLLPLLLAASALGQAQVKGSLSTMSASVGEDLRYELEINGGSPDRLPTFPKVDGIQFNGSGRNAQTIYDGTQWRHTITYIYSLTPERPGEFVIPPVEVIVDGVRYQTAEQKVTVTPQEAAPDQPEAAFGVLKLARPTAYVGEDIQAELRYYFDADHRWSFAGTAMPQMNGDGFGARQPIQGGETIVELGGKRYRRLVFRSAITPSRAGKITIGPLSMVVAHSKRLNARRDLFGGVFEGGRELKVSAPAVEVEVLPLPTEGRPKDFTGAIGSFRFEGSGSPGVVKAGEPVMMTLNIEGQGNFDRIVAPALIDPTGWNSYPPTDRFKPNDPLGLTGVKTFEIAVMPEVKKEKMPVFRFSYFDSTKKAYVTLATGDLPLVVEGLAATPPAVAAAPTDPAAPKPAVSQDILGIRTTPGFWALGWNPSPAVWAALMFSPAPLLAIALYARKTTADPRRRRRAEWLRKRAELMGRIRHTKDRAELYDAAAHLLQLDVALATDQPPGAVDEDAILARRDTPLLRKIFAARAELVYAGGGSGEARANERDEVLEAIEEMGRAR